MSDKARRQFALPPLRSIGLVAAGGAVGGMGRAVIGLRTPVEPGTFPWITFTENVSGAFLLGILVTLLLERVVHQQWVGPLLGTGVLGAFTTFATLAYQLRQLWVDGYPVTAAAYAAATLGVGLTAALAGILTARRVAARRIR